MSTRLPGARRRDSVSALDPRHPPADEARTLLDVAPIEIDGIRSAVHVAGSGRDTVVFVHGNPGPLDDWQPFAVEVARFAQVVAMDLPGFGRADRPPRFDYSIAGYGAFLGALLDRLAVARRVHLVAHDFGGAWATAWAAAHRARVASMTLISTPVVPTFRWHTFARVWQTPVMGEVFQMLASRSLIRAVMRRDNPRPLPADFLDRVSGYADLAQKLRVLRIYRDARDPASAFAPIAEQLRAIDPPACIIWGERDPYAAKENAAATSALFTRAETHVIAGAGHWPFVDEPARVKAIVCDFLRAATGAEKAE